MVTGSAVSDGHLERTVVIAHDYLVETGGAERVVLAMADAFHRPPIVTSLFRPETTYPRFRELDVRVSHLNRIAHLRNNYRHALPLLADTFQHITANADIVICSSSGWAHGINTIGAKVVYCHTPARWLYQPELYLGTAPQPARRAILRALSPHLRRWDQIAAHSATQYIANSTAVRDRIRQTYGIDAEVVPAPYGLDPSTAPNPVPGVEPGFVLVMARLLPYKNVDKVVAAVAGTGLRLVVVGDGPERESIRRLSRGHVTILSKVDDGQVVWLLSNAELVVSASYEDFGLLPLEAALFGRPAAVLRWGGFLDTVADGLTGCFFDEPTPLAIRQAILRVLESPFDERVLVAHAAKYSPAAFGTRLRRLLM